tara:strand:- start:4 stop:609 length:606 start_codon:yes stop_codon:yes gene_type:complete
MCCYIDNRVHFYYTEKDIEELADRAGIFSMPLHFTLFGSHSKCSDPSEESTWNVFNVLVQDKAILPRVRSDSEMGEMFKKNVARVNASLAEAKSARLRGVKKTVRLEQMPSFATFLFEVPSSLEELIKEMGEVHTSEFGVVPEDALEALVQQKLRGEEMEAQVPLAISASEGIQKSEPLEERQKGKRKREQPDCELILYSD